MQQEEQLRVRQKPGPKCNKTPEERRQDKLAYHIAYYQARAEALKERRRARYAAKKPGAAVV